MVVVLVIVLAINCALYSCTNASCKRSGGHTVIVWGGRGGWFCDGGK